MSDYDDYNEKLFFEPDYSVYKMTRKLRKLAKERNFKIRRAVKFYIDFDVFSIPITTRETFTYGEDEFIVQAKSNKHLYDIIEVLTRP